MESDPDCHPMSNIAYIAEQLKPALASKKEVCGESCMFASAHSRLIMHVYRAGARVIDSDPHSQRATPIIKCTNELMMPLLPPSPAGARRRLRRRRPVQLRRRLVRDRPGRARRQRPRAQRPGAEIQPRSYVIIAEIARHNRRAQRPGAEMQPRSYVIIAEIVRINRRDRTS